MCLTHWGRVTQICVSKLTTIGSSHYLNQCWNIVNWTLGTKLQWNLDRNPNIFIQENAFESVVCETAAILSRPQCVKRNHTGSESLIKTPCSDAACTVICPNRDIWILGTKKLAVHPVKVTMVKIEYRIPLWITQVQRVDEYWLLHIKNFIHV